MSIEKNKKYVLIYSSISFLKSRKLFLKIKKDFELEIPYFDILNLSEDIRGVLDNYLYLEVDKYNKNIIVFLNSKYKSFFHTLKFNDLGIVSGKEILDLINNCISNVKNTINLGDYYKICKGHPLSNLIIKVISIKEDKILGSYHTFCGENTIEVPISKIKYFKNLYLVEPQFINYLKGEQKMGNYKAIILDGHQVLYRSMFGFKNTYRSRDHRFVGGAYGFYFTLLKLKELFPEYEIHIVFDGYDKIKFEENPEYKQDRVKRTESFKEDFKYNLDWIKKFSFSLGFNIYHLEGNEGDDVIGSIANFLDKKLNYQHIYIYSKDMDFYSILNEKIDIYLPRLEFRNTLNIITTKEALERFEVNRIDKINWVKTIKGDTSDSIIGVNGFNTNNNIKLSRVKKQNYIDLINSSNNVEEFKSELYQDKKFKSFIDLGQFDKNLKLLTIQNSLFTPYRDLNSFSGIINKNASLTLLEEFSFFKEIEIFDKNYRIFLGIW